ncbi:MAG: MFS transporter [Dehalococcoidia bacterium]|nr:MFS transporter [Dehalococcoidia bacterium]
MSAEKPQAAGNTGSDKPAVPPRQGHYYGWYVIAALFFATFLAIGSRQGFGVFVKTWEQDWEVSTATISIAAATGWLVNGISQPFVGRMTDLYGGRRVVVLSLLVMGIATIGVAAVTNVYGLIALYGFVISFASGGISPAATGVIVARWFERKRGLAMAVLIAGGSAGGLIVVPFLSYLLIEYGWRVTWIVIGALALGLGVPLLLIVVRSTPADMGLQIDGEASPETGNGGDTGEAEITVRAVGPSFVENWRDSLSSKPIWQLSFAYWVCGITTASIAVHFVRWAISEDITTGTAALAFGVLSGVNAGGVLVIGVLSDRWQRKNLLGAVYLVRGLAFISLIVIPGPTAIWVFAIVGGMSWLATVPLTASLTADVYGVRNLGTLFGFATMSHQLGGAAAVMLFGWAFTAWDSYDIPFAIGAATLLAAGIVSFSIREKSHSVRYVQVSQPPGTAEGTAASPKQPAADEV